MVLELLKDEHRKNGKLCKIEMFLELDAGDSTS